MLTEDANLAAGAPLDPGRRFPPSTEDDDTRRLRRELRRGPRCLLDLQEGALSGRDDEVAHGARLWLRHLRKQIAKGEYVCSCAPCRRRRELDADVTSALAESS